MNIKNYLSVLFISFSLVACGGGGTTPSAPTVLQGVFLDSVVEGLTYTSVSQSGTTDANGTFNYVQGETITFKVGDIVIGTATAKGVMTPISLVSVATDETNPTVINIVRFLLTIDDDNDPTNGIQITAAVDAASIAQSLDFTLSTSAFSSDANILNVIALLTSASTSVTSTLVSESVAQIHLNNTLLTTMAGIYNGTFSGDGSGTWSIVVTTNGVITGSGCANSTDPFSAAGTVSSDGVSALGFASDGNFAGSFDLAGTFSGTWSANGGIDTGTFTGSKADTSSVGSCSGGSQPPPSTGGGDTTPPSGSVSISGTDTNTIGTTFTPVYDNDSFENSFITSAFLFDVNIYTSSLGTDARFLVMAFSPTDDSPMSVGFGKITAGSQDGYNYNANCLSGDDCSGVSFNRSTMTVTFTNVVLPKELSDLDNLATDSIALNGTVTFSIP